MTRSIGPTNHYVLTRHVPKAATNEHCRKITYRQGDAYECGAPTKGRTYCAACAMHLITLTDRVPASVEPPRKHPWRENMKL